jgi:hypothetical protein
MQCYGEDGFHNRIFDIGYLTVCPRHRSQVVDRCQKCGVELLWSRRTLASCRNGHPLPVGQVLPANVCSSLSVEKLIFDRCNQALHGDRVSEELPEQVRVRPLIEQLALFRLLGAARRDFIELKGLQTKFWDQSMSDVLNDGFDMARKWPDSLQIWLEDRYEPSQRGPSDLGDRIRALQRSLQAPAIVPIKDIVLPVISDFADRHRVYGRKGARWRSDTLPKDSTMSLEEVAAAMGTSFRRARKVAVQKGWISPGRWQHSNMLTVNRDLVDDWLFNMREELSLDAAARVLGLDRAAMDEVMELELLGFRRRFQRSTDAPQGQWRVEKGEIFDLYQHILSTMSPSMVGDTLSVKEFRRSHHMRAFDFGILLKGVLLGRLKPAGWGGDLGLRDLAFERRVLLDFFGTATDIEAIRRAPHVLLLHTPKREGQKHHEIEGRLLKLLKVRQVLSAA